MSFGLKEYVIAIVPTILQILITFVVLRRRLYRQLPFFLTYTIYQVGLASIGIAQYIVKPSEKSYFYTYYFLQTISLVLAFCVIYEVFGFVLQPYDAFRRIWRTMFLCSAVGLTMISVAWIAFGSGAPTDRVSETINLTLRSLRVIQAGILLFLFALARSLGLGWRSYVFGIALGYGIYAIVDLVLVAMRTEYGNAVWHLQSLLSTTAYALTVVIWAWYILQPERVAQPVRLIPYNDIAKWNEKLEELLKKKAA
jgi:hypothetical protein